MAGYVGLSPEFICVHLRHLLQHLILITSIRCGEAGRTSFWVAPRPTEGDETRLPLV